MNFKNAQSLALVALTLAIAFQSFCFYKTSAEMNEYNKELLEYSNGISKVNQEIMKAQIHMENAVISMLSLNQFDNLSFDVIYGFYTTQVKPKMEDAEKNLSEASRIRTQTWENVSLNREEITKWENKSQLMFIPIFLAIISITLLFLNSKNKFEDYELYEYSILFSLLTIVIGFIIPISGLI